MPFQVSPGVNVSEIDLTTVVPNVATSIGAAVGQFQWGPVNARTTVISENDLVSQFGKPDADTFEDFFTSANYLSYSNNLIQVRVTEDDARNAAVSGVHEGTAIKTDNIDDYEGENYTDQLFVAKYPGKLGNTLKAIVIDSAGWADMIAKTAANRTVDETLFFQNFNGAPATSADVKKANGGVATANDEMHVLVVDEDGQFTGTAGEVLETFAYVSKASDALRFDGSNNYIKNVLKNESRYIWLGNIANIDSTSTDGATAVGSVKAGAVFNTINVDHPGTSVKIMGGSLGGNAGSLGKDGAKVARDSGKRVNGFLDNFADPEIVDVTLVIGGPIEPDQGKLVIDGVLEVRKDCVGFFSPSRSSVVNTVSSSVALDNITGANGDNFKLGSSNYAIMDSAWKYQYDRYRDDFVYAPMNGDIAGLCARTDFTNDPWFSPAGFNRGVVKNIVRPSWDAQRAHRDALYKIGTNPVVTQPAVGTILFGDKTMQAVPSAFDRINVRRLFIVLEKAISIAAKSFLFEFNDEFTRAQFVSVVSPFLREVQGRRGITDFKVVCDSTNNTGQVIDTNSFVGDIYIKPNRSINFIQLNFIAVRTDVDFTEIGG